MGSTKGAKRAAKKVATKAGKKLAKKGTAKTVGKTLGKAAGELLKVIDVVNAIKDLSIEWQRQKTARKQIEAELKVRLKELNILEKYLDKVLEIWDRRQRESLKKLFKTLDEGLKKENVEIVGVAIGGIVNLAQTFPPSIQELLKGSDKILKGETEIEI